jgi:ABC-type phosphate transport system substrate-binding protein
MKNKLITKKIYSLGLFIVLFFAGYNNINAQISIVVSKASQQKANNSEIKEIFLGARLTWANGSKILVIDQSDSESGKLFYNKFLEKSTSQIRMQWTKLVLSGQATAPEKVNDDEDVKKALANNPNAIGYISSKFLDSSVIELFRIE